MIHTWILKKVVNGVGCITLNRPEALNATHMPMGKEFLSILDEFEKNDDVHTIIVEGTGRAFCAGGDIRAFYEMRLQERFDLLKASFETEYGLCYRLATFPKPIISLIDGYCMGGGMGLMIYTPYRVATPKAVFAMPEVCIGFFPDVAAAHFLNQIGPVGHWMGITGGSVGAEDATRLGIATHLIEDKNQFKEAFLADPNRLKDILNEQACTTCKDSDLAKHHDELCDIFSLPTLLEINERLKQSQSAWMQQWITSLHAKSPISMWTTHEMLKRSTKLTMKQAFEQDFILSLEFCRKSDFMEGVRALIIEKDKKPRWKNVEYYDNLCDLKFPLIGGP